MNKTHFALLVIIFALFWKCMYLHYQIKTLKQRLKDMWNIVITNQKR